MGEFRLRADCSAADNQRASLIEHVLLVHLQRLLQGEHVVDDELLAQHPKLMPELAEGLQLFREMAGLRVGNETPERVNAGSDIGLLCIRCPHCHEAVEVPAEACLHDITCSGCGSRFRLADENAARDQVAAPNQQLGHFELIHQLGFGSFGTVWKGRDLELDRFVAVKIPRRGKLNSSEVAQFLREAARQRS